MQTFLPYPDFHEVAACLDRRRLGKQRVETLQILKALAFGGGWSRHPAVRMWKGYEQTLADYGLSICFEWIGRGYRDTCTDKIAAMATQFTTDRGDPPWLGDEMLHSSHRAALLFKDPEHYSQFGWPELPVIDYYWPRPSILSL